MNLIIRLLLTALAVVILSNVLPGIELSQGFTSAIILAIVLGILNAILKPILVILTLPITILTLGLFLLVINAFIILVAGEFLSGFSVSGFWTALLFSLLLSFLQSLLYSFMDKE